MTSSWNFNTFKNELNQHNAAGSSPLERNPDSLLERRYYRGGKLIKRDTLRMK